MSLISRLFALIYKLPPAETYDIAVEKKLEIPMADGVTLRADRYYARSRPTLPTLLIRTPYSRASYGMSMGVPMAERGFQVLVQSCRGTDDSGGRFTAFRGEREDGLATLEWLKQQAWFDGRLGMCGPSYMGFTQWALASGAGPILKAISTQVTSSEFRSVMYPGGSLNLEIFLQWIQITRGMKGSMLQSMASMLTAAKKMKAAVGHLPLSEADVLAAGDTITFWQDWLAHAEPDDPWWDSEDFSADVANVTAPNHMVSGWYDFMLPQLLRDFATSTRAGQKPYLTIGPWAHSSNGLAETNMHESIKWLRAHLHGEKDLLREAPVRIFVVGANEWRDLQSWPPSNVEPQRWYLQPANVLERSQPSDSQPSQYRYDPSDPTPNVGGPTNATLGKGTGPQDNRQLEARSDVITFTSQPLTADIDIIGPLTAELYVKSSLAHTDFFVRLCDVFPDGKSMNVCDGLLRLTPGHPEPDRDGVRMVVIALWPTAYRFLRGHCLRVQVSSGAHPRYARNHGSGEPIGSAVKFCVADQTIFHDPQHPSSILLPIAPL